MRQLLVIMQGPPGSGKSTLAKQIAKALAARGYRVVICSTDEYFSVGGTYYFDPSRLSLFHRLNSERVERALRAGKTVIVDNTHTRCWEAKKYVEMALSLGIEIAFYKAVGEHENIHGVPKQKVEEMKRNMEVLTIKNCLNSWAPWEILHYSI